MHVKLQNLSEKCENIKSTYILKKRNLKAESKARSTGQSHFTKRYITFNELVIKNTLVKKKTIFDIYEGFHLSHRQQISLQKQPSEVLYKERCY